jgi:hypothetical protein
VSAAAVAGLLEDCGTATKPTPTTTTLGPATTTDWASLGGSLTGSLVRPSDRSYGVDRLLYNAQFVPLKPQGIAYCATPDDVARCVEFASVHALDVVARSGGHSYGGYSSCNGLIVDVGTMASITINSDANVATVGSGAKMIDVYNNLGSRDRLLPGGSCPSVGIAGLTLGGGIGVFGRKFGLTTDNLLAVNMVTADGRHLRADATSQSDLLWACQGGGGGNFGVATSFEFSIHPMPTVTLFTLQYPWAAAAAMLQAWLQWIDTAPDELWSNCQLLSQGSDGFLAQIGGVFCGSTTELSSWLETLKNSIGVTPSYSFTGSDAYMRAMMVEAGCSQLTVASCHLSTEFPGGQLGRTAYTAKSNYVTKPMSAAQAEDVVSSVAHLQSVAPYLGGGLAFDSYGGIINSVASSTTAFVHRDKLACIQASYSWSDETSIGERSAGQGWLTWLGATLFNNSAGAYQNYLDPSLVDWQSAYYGANFDRLVMVKQSYDPDNVFHFDQSIPVTTSSASPSPTSN